MVVTGGVASLSCGTCDERREAGGEDGPEETVWVGVVVRDEVRDDLGDCDGCGLISNERSEMADFRTESFLVVTIFAGDAVVATLGADATVFTEFAVVVGLGLGLEVAGLGDERAAATGVCQAGGCVVLVVLVVDFAGTRFGLTIGAAGAGDARGVGYKRAYAGGD